MKLYSVFDNDQWVADMTADDIAEKLCQFVYDLKIEFKKQEDGNEK